MAFLQLFVLFCIACYASAIDDAIIYSRTLLNGTGEIFIMYPNGTHAKLLDGTWPRLSLDKSMLVYKFVNPPDGAAVLPLILIHGNLQMYNLTSREHFPTNWLDDVSYTFLGDNTRLFFDSSDNQTIIWPNGNLFRTFSAADNTILQKSVDAPAINPTNTNMFVLSDYTYGNMIFWEQDFDVPDSVPMLSLVSNVPLYYHFTPEFSPDGSKIATIATDASYYLGNLVIIENRERIQLTNITDTNDSLEMGIAWASNGLSVFVGGHINDIHGIYQINISTGEMQSIFNGSTEYSYFVGSVCNPCLNSTCKPGFSCSQDICVSVCEDIDECLTTPCESNKICTNWFGGYTCSCPFGYVQCSNQTCVPDISLCILTPQDCTSPFSLLCTEKNICVQNSTLCATPDECPETEVKCFDGSCSNNASCNSEPPSTLCSDSDYPFMCESGECVANKTDCNKGCEAKCWNNTCVSDLYLCSQAPSFIKPVPFQVQLNSNINNFISLASSSGSIFGAISIPANSFSPNSTLQVNAVDSSVLYRTQKLEGWEDILSNILSPLVNITISSSTRNYYFNVTLSWTISPLPTDVETLCLGFINETSNAWECVNTELQIAENGTVSATTNHFTSFAVLVNVHETSGPSGKNEKKSGLGVNINVIYGVGAGIVAFALGITIAILIIRQQRRKRESLRMYRAGSAIVHTE